MTEAVIYRASDSGSIKGFKVEGHSGYADAGSDIVCAAVSMLVINTMNSIEKFTDDKFDASMDEDNTVIRFEFLERPSEKSVLLTDSMILGLKTVQENYGKDFLNLFEKEV
jgi:hypothetical protein